MNYIYICPKCQDKLGCKVDDEMKSCSFCNKRDCQEGKTVPLHFCAKCYMYYNFFRKEGFHGTGNDNNVP